MEFTATKFKTYLVSFRALSVINVALIIRTITNNSLVVNIRGIIKTEQASCVFFVFFFVAV